MPRTHAVDPKMLAEYQEAVRKIIRMEMVKKDLTFGDLAKMLNEAGLKENERNLRNKIARGEFSAPFMLMCLSVMGVKGYEQAAETVQDYLIEKQGKQPAKRNS